MTNWSCSEEQINNLRQILGTRISEFRFSHTLGVEKCVARMAALYCPDKGDMLRVAALLHDMTKEWSVDEHILFLEAHQIPCYNSDRMARKTLHARTAEIAAAEQFPDIVNEDILSAIRWHTTGHAGMTLTEKLLYLADYIEETRTFPDCVRLRELFWEKNPQSMTLEEKMNHLDQIMITSFDMTIQDLVKGNELISQETVEARNDLLSRTKQS